MSKKIPEHLIPLQNELSVTMKNGRFESESGNISYKTAKEAVAHNESVDKYLEGFLSNRKPTPKPKPKTTQPQINFDEQMQGIRAGLRMLEENRKLLYPTSKSTSSAAVTKTSTGLNYLMGYDDE